MTIAEKIKQSEDATLFTLYREGIFYKCYNEDAMVFSKCVKAYKISIKFVKNVGVEVMSLGFPASEVEKENLSLELISQKIGARIFKACDNNVIFILDNTEVKSNYDLWAENLKEEIAVDMLKEPESPYMSIDVLDGIASMIKDFDLANSTPMQGLNFIQQLKSMLNNREKINGNI
jgi:hypothetical protein